ncbi:MAG: SRPBCC family protein [Fimbriiglobus sp.]
MWLPILLSLLALLAIFSLFVFLKSDVLKVVRSTTIQAPRGKIFEEINDIRRLNSWNPWMKLDPAIQLTYEGPSSGIGASYSWTGNKNVGAGRQTIVDSDEDEMVRLKLEFIRPFPGTNEVEFTLVSTGNGTLVTWKMEGKLHIIAKAISVFMNMEKMCGNSFEEGLASLKKQVEEFQNS